MTLATYTWAPRGSACQPNASRDGSPPTARRRQGTHGGRCVRTSEPTVMDMLITPGSWRAGRIAGLSPHDRVLTGRAPHDRVFTGRAPHDGIVTGRAPYDGIVIARAIAGPGGQQQAERRGARR